MLPSSRVVRFGGVIADWSRGRAEYSVEIRGQRVHVWGSRIFQNITQSVCRDILAEALVRADARGIAVVMHVHDEIVAEMLAGQGFGLLREIMETAPSWADDLPLAAKLETRRRNA